MSSIWCSWLEKSDIQLCLVNVIPKLIYRVTHKGWNGINTACFLKFMVRLYPATVNLIISSVNHEIIHWKTIFRGFIANRHISRFLSVFTVSYFVGNPVYEMLYKDQILKQITFSKYATSLKITINGGA